MNAPEKNKIEIANLLVLIRDATCWTPTDGRNPSVHSTLEQQRLRPTLLLHGCDPAYVRTASGLWNLGDGQRERGQGRLAVGRAAGARAAAGPLVIRSRRARDARHSFPEHDQ